MFIELLYANINALLSLDRLLGRFDRFYKGIFTIFNLF